MWGRLRPDSLDNSVGFEGHVVVCPYSHYPPASGRQPGVGVTITGSIRRQLGSPEVGVGSWAAGVDRTSVPEAPVDKDGDLGFGEENVSLTAQAGHHLGVDSIAQAATMELTPQRQLRCRVSASGRTHAAQRCGRRRLRNPSASRPRQVRLSRCARRRCHSRGPCGGSSGRSTRRPRAAGPAVARPLGQASRR